LAPGDEIIITENQQAIARIVSEQTREVKQRPAPGMFPESIVCMPPDFDAPLEEFKEYMDWNSCSLHILSCGWQAGMWCWHCPHEKPSPIPQPHAPGVMALPNHHRDPFDRIMIAIELDGLCWIPSVKTLGIELADAGLGLSEMIAGRESTGVDFLAGVGAGRAKLLLSRIPAASAAPISAAP
jgi:antitoxin (DNA-binding transcriptional repressor) of toxin-antitoxin stability system